MMSVMFVVVARVALPVSVLVFIALLESSDILVLVGSCPDVVLHERAVGLGLGLY